MPVKKTELYSSLWKSCDELRGGMDASQYKDYVLVLLFVKYVSDKYAGHPEALIEVPEGGGFQDMVALKGDKEIGDKINKIIGRLAEANELQGVIDLADFNDPDKLGRGKEMVDRLTNLVAIFQNPGLDFSANRAEGDDILGDAYEYLMRHFATQSGKSKGQFYTPAEVSRVMASVIQIERSTSQTQTLNDPTCGSASLLIKAADRAPHGITIYGQEIDNATAALARMNMILHGHPDAEIWRDNTLSSPYFKNPDGSLKTFDYIVANPPFSTKAWSNGFDPEHDLYGRFEFGIPPKRNGDYAFLLHILRSLKSTGKGVVVMPHGVLFRGNAEADIRRELVRRGFIKGIIGLPANLFYGTGIPACLVVLDKETAAARTGIFMVDASQGYAKDGAKNRLRHQDIRKIVDVFNGQVALDGYSRMVPLTEIQANDYNLNIPRYIDTTEPEDIQDIAAHLHGGIPDRDIADLDRYWAVFPSLRSALFEPQTPAGPPSIAGQDTVPPRAIAAEVGPAYGATVSARAQTPPPAVPAGSSAPAQPAGAKRGGYSDLRVPASEIKAAILDHPEFVAYNAEVNEIFDAWVAQNRPRMLALQKGARSRDLIDALSESLLAAFRPVRLIDRYDVYQHLMTYWTEVMQDDVYMITTGGWTANAELIPPRLVIDRYFAAEQRAIDDLEVERERVKQQQDELQEEHSGEEGLLAEVVNDRGNITKGAVRARIKDTQLDPEAADEYALLTEIKGLQDKDTSLGRRARDAQKKLDARVERKTASLSRPEVQALVVDDKWLASLAADLQAELDTISQALTRRITELADRYADPLPQIEAEVDALSAKVAAHLVRMGYDV
jgi:type I restriction enzyme M protein